MKTMAGVLVMAVVMLTGCGSVSGEEQLQGGEAAPSEQNLRTQEFALVGDCSVSLECTNGSRVSCSGTSAACSASPGTNGGSVTCNGVTKNCGLTIPPCSCRSDGCCNQLCALDPDCG
ncbi:hypothetical protein [Archangium violaceum]|uniref:hypothetical protein n=1 Tax=Archangium violaceum TaxID=83451 RepID=UPI0036D9D714